MPLNIEKEAVKVVPGLRSDPWLPGGRYRGVHKAFTAEMVDIVGDIYQRDIRALGYDF